MRGVQGEGVERGAPGLDGPRAGAEVERDHPLTRRQTLFWLDEQLYPGVPYHHIVLRITLTGALDLERLRAAYRDTLLAFDQYRLVFSEHDGEPRQRFVTELNVELPLIDLSAESQELDKWIARRATAPFDFTQALFDAAVLRLSSTQHVFYFCQHHIISDGGSVALFVADLAQRYRGEPAPERPSYLRYLRHEQAYQRSARADRDAAYFSKRLGTADPTQRRGPADAAQARSAAMPPLSLYGRTRKQRTLGMVRTRVDTGEERCRALAELVKDPRFELMDAAMSRLLLLSTLLFAFLYRASGSRTLVIATPLPNRGVEFLGTGGLIMEQTFLRVDIDEGETFATLADKVRTELIGALRHGKHCISDRGLSYATLNLLRLPSPDFDGLGVELDLAPISTWFGTPAEASPRASLVPPPPPAAGDLRDTFGLHVIGFDEDKPLRVGFDFHAGTFDAALQARARGHFFALFDALLADPAHALDGVELLAPQERDELLQLARGRDPAVPAPDPLLRFRDVLVARPEHVALRFAGQSVSYEELFASAGRVASRLVALGARPGARVAFCLARGPDELLAMLASWIAGAAYVPIDGSHPQDRVQMILEDAAPDVLITQRDLVDRLRVPQAVHVLLLDEERTALASEVPLPLPGSAAAIDPEQPAYVLFTSGSTGRPKGVTIPRRAIANFLASMAEAPGLKPDDRLLAVTTTTFDIAGLELLLPLWVGACVQIADRETVLDAHKLRETLERDAITVMQATPTGWRLLLEAGFGREQRHALKMLCGGEAISRELAARLLDAGGELWNMYGPTETTVWSTIQPLARGDETIRIGRPIDATQCYVLGPARRLEPQGVTGELYIGGAGVALGYLGRDELTRERFVQNPYGPPGDVIYRTGDLARFLPDGTLECLGRVDHQVKLRGFRIELGEIESCLRAEPALREVVVVAAGPAHDPRLVAYWVGAPDAERALRERAARGLPSFMQPTAYVRLPALPLNTNGKIDRNQLPDPDWSQLFGGEQQQFANDLELRMAGLFQEVLDGLEVPVDKDFFLLGGDSVRAMHLRRRIREEFGSELPLSVMFETPTVRSLVSALDARNLPKGPLFVRLRAGHAREAPLICVMGVAVYRDLALALSTDRAVYGAHVPLAIAEGQAAPSVEEIAAHYTELILDRVPRGPYHLLGLCFGGLVAFEVAHQLLARGHEVQTLAVLDGLLPRGARYSPLSHARALLADPQRLVRRARERVKELIGRKHVAPATPAEAALDLALQGNEAARLARIYDGHARPLPLPFTLFRATEREEAAWYTIDPALGWSSLGAAVSVHSVPGSHLGILQRGSVAPIAEVLSAQLEGGTAERVSLPPRASLLS
jgi:amino acid adenylation domain-containing protein